MLAIAGNIDAHMNGHDHLFAGMIATARAVEEIPGVLLAKAFGYFLSLSRGNYGSPKVSAMVNIAPVIKARPPVLGHKVVNRGGFFLEPK
jgi:hypothetical protein